MSENATSMPHDAIFKQFLQDPATARDFLQIHLPGSLQRPVALLKRVYRQAILICFTRLKRQLETAIFMP